MTPQKPIGTTGLVLLFIFFSSLAYMALISYQSIEFDILDRLESQPLILPTPLPTPESTPSATPQVNLD
jgi:hypothetical protein